MSRSGHGLSVEHFACTTSHTVACYLSSFEGCNTEPLGTSAAGHVGPRAAALTSRFDGYTAYAWQGITWLNTALRRQRTSRRTSAGRWDAEGFSRQIRPSHTPYMLAGSRRSSHTTLSRASIGFTISAGCCCTPTFSRRPSGSSVSGTARLALTRSAGSMRGASSWDPLWLSSSASPSSC